jgi:hypothetical protein
MARALTIAFVRANQVTTAEWRRLTSSDDDTTEQLIWKYKKVLRGIIPNSEMATTPEIAKQN